MRILQSASIVVLLSFTACAPTLPEEAWLVSFEDHDDEIRYSIIDHSLSNYRPDLQPGSEEWQRLRTVAYRCAVRKASKTEKTSERIRTAQAIIFDCWDEDAKRRGKPA